MKHRFIGKFNIKVGNIRIEDSDLVNQIRNVLKLRTGEQVILSDGNLNEGTADLIEFGKNQIIFNIKEVHENQNELHGEVVLYCAILKKENFELVVQKATEVGVSMIVPIITERTVKLNLRQDRLEKIIKEAAEQAGRGYVPTLKQVTKFKEAVSSAGTPSNILFDRSGRDLKYFKSQKSIGVWIGPEGGWTKEELETARKYEFSIISLGSLTLRAETAAIVSSFLSTHLLESNQ